MGLLQPPYYKKEPERSPEYTYIREWFANFGKRPLWYKIATWLIVLFVFQTLRIVLKSLDIYILEDTLEILRLFIPEGSEEDYEPPRNRFED
jgi:hypothetical protein